MPDPHLLNERLDAIAQSLKATGRASALLGLGSGGNEQDRIDAYSDLDFFVIAKSGHKEFFLNDLSWLSSIAKQGYVYRNTVDGYKFLYMDGVFCEFAVFELPELSNIPFAEGRVVWSDGDINPADLKPVNQQFIYHRSTDIEWLLGEALTNLYTGMSRYCRGEKLSAMRLVQQHAVDRLLDLVALTYSRGSVAEDIYMPDRRFEFRFPEHRELLSRFCPGYDKTPQSAQLQLDWLGQHYTINAYIADEITNLVTGSAANKK